jgi:hypothetical protein
LNAAPPAQVAFTRFSDGEAFPADETATARFSRMPTPSDRNAKREIRTFGFGPGTVRE